MNSKYKNFVFYKLTHSLYNCIIKMKDNFDEKDEKKGNNFFDSYNIKYLFGAVWVC